MIPLHVNSRSLRAASAGANFGATYFVHPKGVLMSIFTRNFPLNTNLAVAQADNAMILATQVHKTFRTGKIEVHALRGVNLTVRRGEMVAIMGPSGCGKTTLLNCLSGLDEFDEGEVFIEGTNLRQMGDRRRTAYRAARMGFVLQTYNLLPVITAVENVELPLLVSNIKPAEARRRALAALERVDLGHRAHHRPAELSGGQRQRVTIARSLVNNPAIVWADEPTGNLDSKSAQDIINLMRQLNQSNQQTFVIVTHDPAIGAQCDRIVRMQDGNIVADGTPGETPDRTPEIVPDGYQNGIPEAMHMFEKGAAR